MYVYERRKSIRIEIDVCVNFDNNTPGKTKNICKNGICIIINKHYKKGTFLTLVFTLPGLAGMKVIGIVIWSRENETSQYEIGIEFWYIEQEDRKKIKEYILLRLYQNIKIYI